MFSQNYVNQLQKEAQDKGGNSGNNVCECKRSYFSPEPDKYIDMVIIPYRAGANNPLVKRRIIQQGEWVFSLDLFIHSKIGIDKNAYICPKNWNEKCPICDLQYKIFKEQGKEAAQGLRASKRSWLNISLCDQQGSRYGEMLVFNPSYVLFTEKLLETAIAKNRGLGFTPFADVEKGNVVSCHTIQGVLGKNKFVDYASFDLGQRSVPIPQDFVKNAICFEDHLKMPDINELMDLASDGGSWQTQPRAAEPPAIPQYSQPSYQQPQPPYSHPPQPAPNYAPAQEYRPEPRAAAQLPPAYAPAPAQQVQEADVICPSGYRFGVDCDSQRACHYCEVWDSCKQRQTKSVG